MVKLNLKVLGHFKVDPVFKIDATLYILQAESMVFILLPVYFERKKTTCPKGKSYVTKGGGGTCEQTYSTFDALLYL